MPVPNLQRPGFSAPLPGNADVVVIGQRRGEGRAASAAVKARMPLRGPVSVPFTPSRATRRRPVQPSRLRVR